jgi:MerR family transcriptional regulator, mercuric resistance operon regulatory protein
VYPSSMLQKAESPPGTIHIGDVSKRTALSIDAIRLYERRALMPHVPRTPGRFRLYTADDVARLSFIRQMQGVGFSLREIKSLLDLRADPQGACRQVSELLKTKLANVRSTIRQLKKLEQELVVDLKKCNRELRYSKKHPPRNCPILQVPNRANGEA